MAIVGDCIWIGYYVEMWATLELCERNCELEYDLDLLDEKSLFVAGGSEHIFILYIEIYKLDVET